MTIMLDGTFGYRIIHDFADKHAGEPPCEVARLFVDRRSADEITAFAIAYVCDEIEQHRRYRVRAIERQAEEAAAAEARAAQAEERRRTRERDAGQRAADRAQHRQDNLALMERYRDQPSPLRRFGLTWASEREQFVARFQRWMGDGYGVWYRNAKAEVGSQSQVALVCFRLDWEPDYEPPDALSTPEGRFAAEIAEMFEREASRIRLEVTAELLESLFAIGDGTRVAWGDATVAQHRQRIDHLLKQAGGTVETAARHRAAINMIEEASVTCLRDLPVKVAA